MIRVFYVALIEVEKSVTEEQGKRFVAAMNELKASGDVIGNVTYFEVSNESEFRKAEQELKAGAK